MYKTLHKKQGSVTVQLRFARSSVTFCAKRDTNATYWIDRRRKYALTDRNFATEEVDKIVVKCINDEEIIVYDTGTGIMKNMEDILFQPLESGKPNREGRGMGLYIVQQLLRSFSADIQLLDERNRYGNRYKFLLSLNTEER